VVRVDRDPDADTLTVTAERRQPAESASN